MKEKRTGSKANLIFAGCLLLLIFVLITMGILRGQDKDAGSGGMAL